MPEFLLRGDRTDASSLIALMHFPDNQENRDRLRSVLDTVLDPDGEPGSEKPPEWILSRWRQLTPNEQVIELSQIGWRGWVAGETLRRTALMQANGVREPSTRKAALSMMFEFIGLKTAPDGTVTHLPEDRDIVLTETSALNYFRNYRPVCHFWAAHRVLEEQGHPFYAMLTLLSDTREMAQFLAYAEWFLDFDIRRPTRNKDRTKQDRALAWTVAPAVHPVEPPLGSFPDSLREAIDRYRAHSAR